MSIRPNLPKRGEVWQVDFDPTKGAEIQKERPAVVISSDAIGRLPLKLVAPITEWKDHYSRNVWHVRVEPDVGNGLTKTSAVDALQMRSLSLERFIKRRGRLTAVDMEEIVTAVAAVIEYD